MVCHIAYFSALLNAPAWLRIPGFLHRTFFSHAFSIFYLGFLILVAVMARRLKSKMMESIQGVKVISAVMLVSLIAFYGSLMDILLDENDKKDKTAFSISCYVSLPIFIASFVISHFPDSAHKVIKVPRRFDKITLFPKFLMFVFCVFTEVYIFGVFWKVECSEKFLVKQIVMVAILAANIWVFIQFGKLQKLICSPTLEIWDPTSLETRTVENQWHGNRTMVRNPREREVPMNDNYFDWDNDVFL